MWVVLCSFASASAGRSGAGLTMGRLPSSRIIFSSSSEILLIRSSARFAISSLTSSPSSSPRVGVSVGTPCRGLTGRLGSPPVRCATIVPARQKGAIVGRYGRSIEQSIILAFPVVSQVPKGVTKHVMFFGSEGRAKHVTPKHCRIRNAQRDM